MRDVVRRATSSQLARNAGEDSSFGFLGPLVAFMIWLWLSTMFVLGGAELDAAVAREMAEPTENECERKQEPGSEGTAS